MPQFSPPSSLEERLTFAAEVVGRDPVARELGIVVEDVSRGRAVVSLVPQARHLNALDRVHGSTMYALADQAVAVAANTLESTALVLEMKINFLAAVREGEKLVATARMRDEKRRVSLWEVEIAGPGGLAALALGTGYHR